MTSAVAENAPDAPEAPDAGSGDGGTRRRRVPSALFLLSLGPLVVLGLLVLIMSLLSDVFFTERNLLNVGIQAAPIALLAIGQFLVILTRGIDLSVAAVAALASVVCAKVYANGDGSTALAILALLGVGLGCGLLNGVLYVGFKLPHPFIVTLGTLNVASGAAYLIADGDAVIGVPVFADTLANDKIFGIPNPIVLVLIVLALFLLLLQRTQLGRWIYAVGGNPEAAVRTGIPAGKVLVLVYTLSGLCAALAAIFLMGRTGTGDPNYARALAELQSIAAVIIGGASFFGGRGHLATVLIGALVLQVIANGLNLLDVNAFWQLIVTGVVLIVAVILDVQRRNVEERVRTAAGASA